MTNRDKKIKKARMIPAREDGAQCRIKKGSGYLGALDICSIIKFLFRLSIDLPNFQSACLPRLCSLCKPIWFHQKIDFQTDGQFLHAALFITHFIAA
jgi:hypothetical protein